jgi:thiamine biosynthesis lipoprotein
VNATFAAMERLIALFDHRQVTTPLSVLNRTGGIDGAPQPFVEIMRRAVAFGAETGGAFDVTVKPLLDALRAGAPVDAALRACVDYRQIEIEGARVRLAIPGAAVTLDGIAKGRIIDEGAATLRALGFDQLLVEAGGDLRTLGARSDATPWRVGIANPRRPDGPVLATLAVRGQAAATSGDYMNAFSPDFALHHILDPHTGQSPLDLASATVIAPTALDADALATALMVLGSRAGLALAERLANTEAVLVTKDLAILTTAGAALS